MDPFTLRPADPRDEPFLFEMLYHSLYVPPGRDPLPRSVLERDEVAAYARGFGTRSGDLGLIAMGTVGDPIGAAWARLPFGDRRLYGYVDATTRELAMAVLPAHRGRGAGTALLSRILEASPEMSLSVDVRNPAVALYTRFGFELVAGDADSVTMLRRVRAGSG